MIIYNVTINVETSVEEEWITFMKKIHIPDVLNTGCFLGFTFTRVLTRQDGEEGGTYSIQYRCRNMKDYDRYKDNFAASMQQDVIEKYGGKFVAFRTLLEEV